MNRPAIRTTVDPDRLAGLIAATAAQDQAAFAELYHATKRKLFGIALTASGVWFCSEMAPDAASSLSQP